MYKLIQRNQKKLLAVFGVLLMIVFIIPPAAKYGGSRVNPVVGHIGNTPIHGSDMQAAKDDWATVREIGIGRSGQRRTLPSFFLPGEIINAIDQHPELFLLLQQEAGQHGLTVSISTARNLISTVERDVDVNSGEPRVQAAVRGAQGLLSIASEVNRVREAVKISQPVWQHDVAQDYQTVRLSIVEFLASDLEKTVPQPTSEQLREQFEKYKDVLPDEAARSTAPDPLGFGYKVPSRVKVQYVEVPHDQVVLAVTGSADPNAAKDQQERYYNWQLKAADYYDKHQEEYRNPPPPASGPATQPAATQPAQATTQPGSQPAIKPFKEVEGEIIRNLVADDAQQETNRIVQFIDDRLNNDFLTIRRSDPAATQPASTPLTTGPASGPAVAGAGPTTQPATALMSEAHLEQLRADVQRQFHVDLKIADLQKDWLDAKELAKLPGVGAAHTADFDEFAPYAANFVGQLGRVTARPLAVWEPSVMLTDSQKNAYVFRLTTAEPAHAPSDMTPVLKQVEADWKLAHAYQQASQAAQKLVDASKSIGLAQAARLESKPVTSATASPERPFAFMPTMFRVSGYDVKDPAANDALATEIKRLLAAAGPSDPHPRAAVALPTVRRDLAIELIDAHLSVPDLAIAQEQVVGQQRAEQAQPLILDWFDYKSVVSRLDYKPEQKS